MSELSKAIKAYERLMGVKLSMGQLMVFKAGYRFALTDNGINWSFEVEKMECDND